MHTKQAVGAPHRERELKLGFRPGDLALLEASALILPAWRGEEAGAEVQHLESVYFDTPEFDLARAGVELRVRRVAAGDWVQTIKSRRAGSHSGFSDRAEYERRLGQWGLKLDDLPSGSEFRVFRSKRVRKRLGPVFATRVERRVYHLAGEGGGEIELSIDMGRLSAGRRTAPLCEVELEAKGAEPENLFRLAEVLSESVDLRPETRGKADRGYALLRRAATEPGTERAVNLLDKVTGDSAKEEVFAWILENALGQIRNSERAILENGDPEGVHRMRVALRRLRAALSMFRGELPAVAREPVRESLRGMLDVLGPAREWDVLVADWLGPAKLGAGDDPNFASVVALAGKERAKAWAQVRKLLSSREYSRTILRLTAWITCRRWREDMTGKELRRFRRPVGKMASEVLDHGHRRLLRAGAQLAVGDDASGHELRIAIKKQRYGLEAVRSCFPAKAARRYGAALEALQDALGSLQDLACADALLKRLGKGQPEPVAAFLGGMLAAQIRERAALREDILQHWADFADMKRPWHD